MGTNRQTNRQTNRLYTYTLIAILDWSSDNVYLLSVDIEL